MDKTTLVGKLEEGKKFIAQLDQNNLEIRAAFWLYDSEKNSWTLLIASTSKQLDVKHDIHGAYRTIVDVFSKSDFSVLESSDIGIVAIDHPFVKNIAQGIRTDNNLKDISITNTVINNLFIEGLHLYRMNLSGRSK